MNKSAFAVFLGIILMASTFTHVAFAENSKCSRDCEAPTLGTLDDGKVIVENGFSINGQSFDISGFSQTIPTQSLVVGEQVTVKMIVYENSGVKALRYTSFAIADYKGERDQNEKASIAFVQDYTGAQKIDVVDFDKLLSDVRYNATAIDSFRTMIQFSFEFAKPVDKSAIVIETWDESKSSRKNVLFDAIQVEEKSLEKIKEEKMIQKIAEKKIEKKAVEKTPVRIEEKKQEKTEKQKDKFTKKPQIAKGKNKKQFKLHYQ